MKNRIISVVTAAFLVLFTMLISAVAGVQAQGNAKHLWSWETDTCNGVNYNGRVVTVGNAGKCELSADFADQAKSSLKITPYAYNSGAAFYYFADELLPRPGDWVNIRVYIPEGSTANNIRFFCNSPSNGLGSVNIADGDKGKWFTHSKQVPANTGTVTAFGMEIRGNADGTGSNPASKRVVYLDSLYTSDMPFGTAEQIAQSPNTYMAMPAYVRVPGTDLPEGIAVHKWNWESETCNGVNYNGSVTTVGNAGKCELSTDFADQAKSSLKITPYAYNGGAAFYYFVDELLPQPGDWVNIRVYIPAGSTANNIRFFCNSPSNGLGSVNIGDGDKGKWFTHSRQVPANAGTVTAFGLEIRGEADGTGSNPASNRVVYLDSLYTSDLPFGTAEQIAQSPDTYMAMPAYVKVPGTDLPEGVAVHKWSWESETCNGVNYNGKVVTVGNAGKCEISTDFADQARASLKITPYAYNGGAAFYYFADELLPQPGDWVNIRVYIPAGSTANNIRFFCNSPSNGLGSVNIGDGDKGKWFTHSKQVPASVGTVTAFGMEIRGEADGTGANPASNRVVYLDSLYTSDLPFGTAEQIAQSPDTYMAMPAYVKVPGTDLPEGIAVHKWSWESNTCNGVNYNGSVSTAGNAGTCMISTDFADQGNTSLKIIPYAYNGGAAFYYFADNLLPGPGDWVNIRVYIPTSSTANNIRFFYNSASNSMGSINIAASDKGKWFTHSRQVPANVGTVTAFGMEIRGDADGNSANPASNRVIYLDSLYTSDMPLWHYNDGANPDTFVYGNWPAYAAVPGTGETNPSTDGSETQGPAGSETTSDTNTSGPTVSGPGFDANKPPVTLEDTEAEVFVTLPGQVLINGEWINSEDLELVVTILTGGEAFDMAASSLSGKLDLFTLFDIQLFLYGDPVEVEAEMTVKVFIPLEYHLDRAAAFYISDSGAASYMKASVSGDYLTFNVKHLSYYAVGELAKGYIPPSTGDAIRSAVTLILLLLSASILVVFVNPKCLKKLKIKFAGN